MPRICHKPWVVEYRYAEGTKIFFSRFMKDNKWKVWNRYKTEKDRNKALLTLKNRASYGIKILEFRRPDHEE